MTRVPPLLALFPLLVACPPVVDDGALVVISEGLDEAVLSVRAFASDDVWMVGSDQGAGPILLHYDGTAWERIDTAALAGVDLWWAHPTAPDGHVVVVGSGGTLVEVDRDGSLAVIDGPGEGITFFGVWGASPEALWAVGGAPGEGALPALWRRTGGVWAEYVDPAYGPGEDGDVFFKVHGRSEDDLWIVGNRGTALHWDGTGLTATETPTDSAPLLTVTAGGEVPVAVGGAGSALILHREGEQWVDRAPDFQPAQNGVCAGPGGAMAAVGAQGSVNRWDGSVWTPDEDAVTFEDFHGCAIDPDGGLWAVGGHIVTRPLNEGIIAYAGEAPPAAWP